MQLGLTDAFHVLLGYLYGDNLVFTIGYVGYQMVEYQSKPGGDRLALDLGAYLLGHFLH